MDQPKEFKEKFLNNGRKNITKKKELQFTIFITILQFNLPELKSSKKSFILTKQSLVFVFNPSPKKKKNCI